MKRHNSADSAFPLAKRKDSPLTSSKDIPLALGKDSPKSEGSESSIEASTASIASSASSASTIVHWATDHKKLSFFLGWVKSYQFFPLEDVPVVVSVEGPVLADPVFPFLSCVDCRKRFQDSKILDRVMGTSWKDVDKFDLETLDHRLYILASSVRGAVKYEFSDGQCKSVLHDLISLVREHGLCGKHSLRLYVSSPSSANDKVSGLKVRFGVKRRVSFNITDSESSSQQAEEGTHLFTDNPMEIKGAPDLCVTVGDTPKLFLLVAENKKNQSYGEDIGQLLTYLMLAQFNNLQQKGQIEVLPPPILGLFMEDCMIKLVFAQFKRTGARCHLQLKMGEEESILNYGLPNVMKVVQNLFSFDY